MRRVAALVAAVTLMLVGSPIAATAAPLVVVVFSQPDYVVKYADQWALDAQVSLSETNGSYVLGPNTGMVDVYLDADPAPYASQVGLGPDGRVYVAPRADHDPLAPGAHTVRVVFVPFGNTGLSGAEATATLTIEPLGLELQSTVSEVTTTSAAVALRGEGTALEAFDGMPAGIWTVTARPAKEGTPVEATVAQAQGDTANHSILLEGLKAGTDYELRTTFVPHESLAAGIVVGAGEPERFSTTSAGLAGVLQSPVVVPTWLAIVIGVVAALITALVIMLSVRARRAAAPHVPALEA